MKTIKALYIAGLMIATAIYLFTSCETTKDYEPFDVLNGNQTLEDLTGHSISNLKVVLVYPVNISIYDRKPSIIFLGDSIFTNYNISIFSDSSFSSLIFETNSANTSNKINVILPFGTIYYKIIPSKNPKKDGSYYESGNFSILQLQPAAIVEPLNGGTNYNKLYFYWPAVVGSDAYQIYLDNGLIYTGTNTNYTLPTNIAYGQHSCFVIATNATQESVSITNSFIISNMAPSILLAYSITNRTNATITIDASGTSDNEGDSFQFNWNGQGFGSVNVYSTNFSTAGSYSITLSVKDSYGNITNRNIPLVIVVNLLPQPSFTINKTSGDRSTVFNVDASGTTDAETAQNNILVKWSWGDGSVLGYNTTKTANHTYSQVSNFTITLTALDGDGGENSITKIVSVTNRYPLAIFISPSSITTNTTFTVDASGSSDPDGDSLQYNWDFGNGATSGWINSNTYSYSYNSAGTNIITLLVKDAIGDVSSTTNQIAVNNSSIPRNGLVAEYLFSGNANDTSGNGNNGTVNGATLTTDRLGNANKAYDFNSGNEDYIDCGNGSCLNFDNQITVSIWMYPNAYGVRLIGKSDNDLSAGWLIDLLNGNQKLKVTIQPSQNLFTPTSLALNTWYHIAYTYNKTDGLTKLYVNGNLVNQTNFTSGSIYYNTKLTIGTFTSSGISYFNGFEDDVRIYNRILSDNEIQALYHEGGW